MIILMSMLKDPFLEVKEKIKSLPYYKINNLRDGRLSQENSA